jgi:hypothetical protein
MNSRYLVMLEFMVIKFFGIGEYELVVKAPYLIKIIKTFFN